MMAVLAMTPSTNKASAHCDIEIDILSDLAHTYLNDSLQAKTSSKESSKRPKNAGKGRKKGKADLTNFSLSCVESTNITVSFENKKTLFQMDKRPKSTKSTKSKMENVFLSGEEENGSSINLLRKPDGQIIGSMTDVIEGTVTQLKVDMDGINSVEIIPSSDFPPEADAVVELVPNKEAPPQRFLFDTLKIPNVTRRVNIASMITIDVLVLWTKNAECKYATEDRSCTRNNGTKEQMVALIELAIFETNTAYEKSGVNLKLELAHSELVDSINEPAEDAFYATLSNLRSDPAVQQKRASYGADIVALIIDDSQYCGMGKHIEILLFHILPIYLGMTCYLLPILSLSQLCSIFGTKN